MTTPPQIFCALDTSDLNLAMDWAKTIGPVTGGLKLGLEFFNSFGPQGVEKVMEACPDAAYFIDLKFHDIPNTVAGAVHAITSNLAPAYLNVHASGGETMMRAAKEACDKASSAKRPTRLLGVTILTSLSHDELGKIGYKEDTTASRVKDLAILAQQSGLDGVVCSAHEIEMLRAECGPDFALMVPGIRPAGADKGDQKRTMTPAEALEKGATHLVIGRPITQSPEPAQTAVKILETL